MIKSNHSSGESKGSNFFAKLNIMASKKKLVLFDIDFTLLNNDGLRAAYRSHLFNDLKIDQIQIEQIYQSYKSGLKADRYFRPKHLVKLYSEKCQIDEVETYKHTFGNPEVYTPFPEVLEVINRLHGTIDIGIWTEGMKGWQSTKVKHMNLLDFINPNHKYIFFNKTTKHALGKIPKDAIIVDDKLTNIDKLLEAKISTPVWINRKSTDKHKTAKTVHDLKEFESWLTG